MNLGKTLTNRVLSRELIKISIVLASTFFVNPHVAIAKTSYNYNDYSSETTEMRYGLMINQMFVGDYGVFFEYQLNEFFSIKTGLEYGYNGCFIGPKDLFFKDKEETLDTILAKSNSKINVKNDIGFYLTKFVSIPVYVRVYPAGGDFSLYLGIETDILLEASRSSVFSATNTKQKEKKAPLSELFESIEATSVKIKTTDKGTDDNELLKPIRFKLFWGIDYETSFGLIFGFKTSNPITNFINYNKDSLDSYFDGNFQLSLGFDIGRVI